MKVILGADHGGFSYKEDVKSWLESSGYEVDDVGALTLEPDDDFVDYAVEAVKKVTSSDDRVLLFCRNGFGMVITANRFVGVRCGLAFDVEAVRRGRVDDDINCLAVPADYVDKEKMLEMIEVFLKTEFSADDKYAKRVMKIDSKRQ